MTNISILPLRTEKGTVYSPNFCGWKPKVEIPLPPIKHPTPKARGVVQLGVSRDVYTQLATETNVDKENIDDKLRRLLGMAPFVHKIKTMPSKSYIVGNCKVTRLTDGKQIFEKYLDLAQNAEKSLLGKFFTFQNVDIDGHRWPTNGAENVEGHREQLKLMDVIIAKKKNNPDFISQQILGAHKWYQDGYGKKIRFYNNMEMIRHLKQNEVDVVPAPRAAQGGSIIDHDKFLIADGKRALITGMNPSTHGPANHDFGWLIESLDDSKPSEIDDFIHAFNASWKFSWYSLGNTRQINGPLNEAEQDFYMGLKKEIKPENVEYMQVVGELFNNPQDLNRYNEGRLPLVPYREMKPEDRKIHLLRTLPKEYAAVGEDPQESIRAELLEGEKLGKSVRNAKKIYGEDFVITENELVDTMIARKERGELDAKLLIEKSIIDEFPLCRQAFNKLKKAGIARLYRGDKNTGEKMHAKLLVIDDVIVSGSANTSERALTTNLGKGLRDDYPLYTERINQKILTYADTVKEFEETVGIPPIGAGALDYQRLQRSKKIIGALIKHLKEGNNLEFEHNGKKYKFTPDDDDKLITIHGYYGIMMKKHNRKRKFKRGNSESSIAFPSPEHARDLRKQIERDWKKSAPIHPELDKDREFPQPEKIDGRWQFNPALRNGGEK